MACAQPLDGSSLLCVISHLNSFQCSRSGSGIRPCADIPSLSIALAMWHYIVFIGWESIRKVRGTRVWSCPGKDLEFRVHLQCECVQLLLCPTLCDPMDYIACQAPLSMEFSRQECWNGLPFPTPEDLSDSGIERVSPAFSAMAGWFFTTETPGKPCNTALYFFFFFWWYISKFYSRCIQSKKSTKNMITISTQANKTWKLT